MALLSILVYQLDTWKVWVAQGNLLRYCQTKLNFIVPAFLPETVLYCHSWTRETDKNSIKIARHGSIFYSTRFSVSFDSFPYFFLFCTTAPASAEIVQPHACLNTFLTLYGPSLQEIVAGKGKESSAVTSIEYQKYEFRLINLST